MPEVSGSFSRVVDGGELRVGAAEADITPATTQYLAGFRIAKVSTGVRSRIKARALVLELDGVRVAIVGIDNLGLMREDVEWIKDGLWGVQNGCAFLCSSHTHSAPDLVGLWGPYLLASGRDPEYVALVKRGVQQAVETAAARARPAVLTRGESRIPPEGVVRNSNRKDLFDRRLTVLHARDAASGEPLGTLLHMACHPEVFRRRNTLISADFVGELCDRWRSAGHGQAVFVNGALGAMITPEPGGDAGLVEIGTTLLSVSERALTTARPLPVTDLEVRRRDIYMPLTSPFFILGRLAMVLPREGYGGLLRSTVGYLRIGSFEAACVPGEMEPTLAARIRQQSGRPNLLLFGLVDDELGYLMREVDARHPGFRYERGMSPVADVGERVLTALTGSRASR